MSASNVRKATTDEKDGVELIERLAAAGADVSASAASGKTPLDIARQYERPDAAAKLVALGGAANLPAAAPAA